MLNMGILYGKNAVVQFQTTSHLPYCMWRVPKRLFAWKDMQESSPCALTWFWSPVIDSYFQTCKKQPRFQPRLTLFTKTSVVTMMCHRRVITVKQSVVCVKISKVQPSFSEVLLYVPVVLDQRWANSVPWTTCGLLSQFMNQVNNTKPTMSCPIAS